jgi:hypothetical protein
VDQEVLYGADGQFQSDTVNRGEDDSYDEEEEEDDEDEDEEEDDDDEMDLETDDEYDTGIDLELWYAKAKLILDHVNDFSSSLCEYPGFALSLDEMMKVF